MFSLKHFLLGAGIGLIPVSLYGFILLKPQPKLEARVLSAETEYIASPSATILPTLAKIPTKAISREAKTKAKPVASSAAPQDISALIEKYAVQYGVNKEIMLHIAKCESGFRSNAVNGPYVGIYQFVSSTWSANRRAMGFDPDPNLRFVAEESVRTAAFKMSRDGYGAWPVCQKKAFDLLNLSSK